MSVIYLLLASSIAVAIIFFVAFILSVKSGQYDDSYTPSVRMLFEDELVKTPTEKQHLGTPKNYKTKICKKREENIEKTKGTKQKSLFSFLCSLL